MRELVSDSFDYYQNFSHETGKSCGFIKTGLVYRFPGPLADELQSHLAILHKPEYRITTMPSGQHVMIHEHAAGCIDPGMTCRAWAQAARSHQGVFYENVTVEKVLTDITHVYGVQTSKGVINSPRVIIAAGAWSRQLLESAGIELPVSVESFQYNIYQSAAHHLGCAYLDAVDKFYLFPLRNGDAVAGLLQDGKSVIDDSFDHQVDDSEAHLLHKRVNRAFPQISEKSMHKVNVSYDAYTEDGRGMVDAVPTVTGLFAATGLSAGGIKIAPALAKKMTKMIKSLNI
jgi:glycine/D-amino acid oxidase-like deaminating enzyme